jgi:hypothetical protein
LPAPNVGAIILALRPLILPPGYPKSMKLGEVGPTKSVGVVTPRKSGFLGFEADVRAPVCLAFGAPLNGLVTQAPLTRSRATGQV